MNARRNTSTPRAELIDLVTAESELAERRVRRDGLLMALEASRATRRRPGQLVARGRQRATPLPPPTVSQRFSER